MRVVSRKSLIYICAALLAIVIVAGAVSYRVLAADAPSGVSASFGGGSSVQIRWNPVGGAVEYYVFRTTYIGGPLTQVGISTQNYFADSVPVLGTTYYYCVVSYDGGKTSTLSAFGSVYVPPPGPDFYVIKIDTRGGASDAPETAEALNGRTLDYIEPPRKTGHSFVGWAIDDAGNEFYDFSSPVLSDFTLYAVWDKLYTVTYCRNQNAHDRAEAFGGSFPKGSQAELAAISSVGTGGFDWARTGFSFAGWALMPDDPGTVRNLSVNEDTRLYAVYKANRRTVTFDYGGFGTDKRQTYDFGTLIDRPEPPAFREGFSFLGWYDSDGLWNFADNRVPDRDITLKARWSDGNTGDIIVIFDYAGEEGKKLTVTPAGFAIPRPEDPVREGYIFKGWYWGADIWDFDSDSGSLGSLTLTAVWESSDVLRSGPYAGFDARISAQTGNLIRDITDGNIPGGGTSVTGYRSLLNTLLAAASIIVAIVIAVRSLGAGPRPGGFRGFRSGLYGRFAILSGFASGLVFALREDFTKPVLLITSNTLFIGLLCLTQVVFLCLYLGEGMRQSGWTDYM